MAMGASAPVHGEVHTATACGFEESQSAPLQPDWPFKTPCVTCVTAKHVLLGTVFRTGSQPAIGPLPSTPTSPSRATPRVLAGSGRVDCGLRMSTPFVSVAVISLTRWAVDALAKQAMRTGDSALGVEVGRMS